MAGWKSELAKRLKEARGMESQASLAARSGVSDRTIGLLEQQQLKRPPRAETVARLSIATNNHPEEWLAVIGITMAPEPVARLRAAMSQQAGAPEPIESIASLKAEFRDSLGPIVEKMLKNSALQWEVDHLKAQLRAVSEQLSRLSKTREIATRDDSTGEVGDQPDLTGGSQAVPDSKVRRSRRASPKHSRVA